METFSWRVNSDDYSEKTTFAVREVKFGDGYAQVQPQGLNNRKCEIQAAITEKKKRQFNRLPLFLTVIRA